MSICVSSEYLSGKVILLYLEQMQVEVGLVIPMVSLNYGKYGGLVTKGWISMIWERIWREGVKLLLRTPTIMPNQSDEDIFIRYLITNTGNFTQK